MVRLQGQPCDVLNTSHQQLKFLRIQSWLSSLDKNTESFPGSKSCRDSEVLKHAPRDRSVPESSRAPPAISCRASLGPIEAHIVQRNHFEAPFPAATMKVVLATTLALLAALACAQVECTAILLRMDFNELLYLEEQNITCAC